MKEIAWEVTKMLIVIAMCLWTISLFGCASTGLYQMSDEWCVKHTAASVARCSKAQSWDQENLKSHDRGCPTAIFIAPGGNLQQCI